MCAPLDLCPRAHTTLVCGFVDAVQAPSAPLGAGMGVAAPAAPMAAAAVGVGAGAGGGSAGAGGGGPGRLVGDGATSRL